MGIFNSYMKPGKGISKEDVDKSGAALYFDIFLRRFWKLITINLLYLIASIPAIIISFFMASYLMGSLITFSKVETQPMATLLLSILFTVIILQITGSGPATVAKNYVLGKYVKDTHAWVFSDFIDNIKNNFVQGMAVYIINTLVFFVSSFAFVFYSFVMQSPMAGVLKVLIIIIMAIFLFMQFYTYRLVAEFKLKVKHIYKNAFILTIVGLKWNLLAAVVCVALSYAMYAVFAEMTIIAIFIIAILYFSLQTFTQMFITNNVIKKYLLEPVMQQNIEEENAEDNE